MPWVPLPVEYTRATIASMPSSRCHLELEVPSIVSRTVRNPTDPTHLIVKQRVKNKSRFVSIVLHDNELYCLDSPCYHASGPLGSGELVVVDIEDVVPSSVTSASSSAVSGVEGQGVTREGSGASNGTGNGGGGGLVQRHASPPARIPGPGGSSTAGLDELPSGGRSAVCLRCPWHNFLVDITTGCKVTQHFEFSDGLPASWSSPGGSSTTPPSSSSAAVGGGGTGAEQSGANPATANTTEETVIDGRVLPSYPPRGRGNQNHQGQGSQGNVQAAGPGHGGAGRNMSYRRGQVVHRIHPVREDTSTGTLQVFISLAAMDGGRRNRTTPQSSPSSPSIDPLANSGTASFGGSLTGSMSQSLSPPITPPTHGAAPGLASPNASISAFSLDDDAAESIGLGYCQQTLQSDGPATNLDYGKICLSIEARERSKQ